MPVVHKRSDLEAVMTCEVQNGQARQLKGSPANPVEESSFEVSAELSQHGNPWAKDCVWNAAHTCERRNWQPRQHMVGFD